VSLQVGDTVETSGCSSIFPEGIVIGTVCDVKRKSEDYFYDVEIRLSTDFSNLSYVDVINYQFAEEQNNLEEAEK
jgi:rod shape-determining protein MreC